jgi:hypothetical protein
MSIRKEKSVHEINMFAMSGDKMGFCGDGGYRLIKT